MPDKAVASPPEWFAPYAAQLDRIEQMLARASIERPAEKPLLTQAETMELLGYSHRTAFWEVVRSVGIPYIPISAKRALFRRADIEAVLRQRQVGRLQSLRL